MLRLIIEVHCMHYGPGIDRRDYTTLDLDIPELEEMLNRGVAGEGGFESWRLLGAEILPAADQKKGSE